MAEENVSVPEEPGKPQSVVPKPPEMLAPPPAPEPVAMPTEPPGAPMPPPPAPSYAPPAGQVAPPPPGEKSKIVAGILAILLGGLGIHKFYLGYQKEGIIMLVASIGLAIVTFGSLSWVVSIIGLVEGVIYLTKTDEDFYSTYVAGRKPWF